MTFAEFQQRGYLEVLAQLFNQGPAVRSLLQDAGVAPGSVPPFGQDAPLAYWKQVCPLLPSLTPGGLEALLHAAAQNFPYNPLLAPFRDAPPPQRRTPPPAPAPPASGAATLRLLFVAANPLDTERLRLDAEFSLFEQLREVRGPRQLDLISRHAARSEDLPRFLSKERPVAVHFSLHGQAGGYLVFDDGHGESRALTAEVLARIFQVSNRARRLRCVLFNGCATAAAAQAVSPSVDVAIGFAAPVADEACLVFSRTFYTALLDGLSVGDAVEHARLQMDLEAPQRPQAGGPDDPYSGDNVVVHVRDGVDLHALDLFQASGAA
jgi:hypothetical protein